MTGHAEPNIQTVTTRGGLTAWLVESDSIPMISVDVSFRAGSAFDPEGQNGLASLALSLLDEGAGDLPMQEYQEEVERIGARIWGEAGLLTASANMATLSENKEKAFELFGLAITQPRYDDEAVERIKGAMLTGLRKIQESPDRLASRAFSQAMYGDHPYGNPTDGREETVPQLNKDMLTAYHAKFFTRKNMVISVVGDITADELAVLLDKTLADVPEGDTAYKVTTPPPAITPQTIRLEKEIPQSTVIFGHEGLSREDDDYYATLLMNEILGGGGLTSRFATEVREKKGLAYFAYSQFKPLPFHGPFIAKVSTTNEKVDEAISLMKTEMEKVQKENVTQEEYDENIQYLTGSFPLRLDSNNKILNYLTFMQMEGLGVDYLATWPDKIRAVTYEAVHKAAQKRLKPREVITVIVGPAPK